MAGATEQIVYSVITQDGGGWRTHGQSGEMQAAIDAADKLLGTRRFQRVRVNKQFSDPENGRTVTATILDKGQSGRREIPVAVWVAIAVLAGIASFAATYFLTHGAA